MTRLLRTTYKCLLLAVLFAGIGANAQEHGWPLEPHDSEHPLGNSFGEFQDFGGIFQHKGIDILATPQLDREGNEDPTANWVVVTKPGNVRYCNDEPASSRNDSAVDVDIDNNGSTDLTYRFAHLEYLSYDATYRINCDNAAPVSTGARIARVIRWDCEFHHLHYDIWNYDAMMNVKDLLNPLADITPNPDPLAPEIVAIQLAKDNNDPWTTPWDPFLGTPGACTVVDGNVDVVTEIRDRDDAGSTLTGAATAGLYDLQWRACSSETPDCDWISTRPLDTMPSTWGQSDLSISKAQFSTAVEWVSDSDYCCINKHYLVPTNWIDASPIPTTAGSWATNLVSNGSYAVSIKATDFAGNVSVQNIHACVQNGGGCTTELTIRDGPQDDGAVPYTRRPFWLSPDITANRGTADENRNINIGEINYVEVDVWNTGTCNVPAGTNYTVCLGWNLPSGSVPYPLPASQVVECKTETVPTGGWLPGTSRMTTFTWTPNPGSLPLGQHCLVASSDMAADPVRNTPSVVLDDNRAQRNITFQAAPDPGTSAYAAFWMYPIESAQWRRMDMSFNWNGHEPNFREVRIHVPPGFVVEKIFETLIIGGYIGDKPQDPCIRGDETGCTNRCPDLRDASRLGCTLVLGGIGPQSHVRLEGVSAKKPERLFLEVKTEKALPRNAFIDAHVLEFAAFKKGPPIAIGGITLRFEGPRK